MRGRTAPAAPSSLVVAGALTVSAACAGSLRVLADSTVCIFKNFASALKVTSTMADKKSEFLYRERIRIHPSV
ncbi:MAG: hypothetical protein ACREGR_01775 [Minisyncoccia bacterium]